MTLVERAVYAVEAHKKVYYDNGDYRKADFWDYAEIFEIIEDLYDVSEDKALFTQFSEMYNYVVRRYGFDWRENPFNDDIMWLVIAMTRAYIYTNEQKYLEIAEHNFAYTFDRAYSEALGGGLFWRIENRCKNTCVNCPGAVAAGLLYKATEKTEYADKLKICLDWAVKIMFEPDTGKVYDCINLDGSINKWSSTYNQGTFIGSCLFYYRISGNEAYLKYAESAADYVMNSMYNGGIMDNEENGNDLPGFKGILSRYIRYICDLTDNTSLRDWLRRNADSAWDNRNALGLMQTRLSHKTEDGTEYDVFSMSAAVSVIVNSAETKTSAYL